MAETAKSKAQAEAHLDEIERELERLKSVNELVSKDKANVVGHVLEVLGNIAESHNFYDSQRMAAEAMEWLKKA